VLHRFRLSRPAIVASVAALCVFMWTAGSAYADAPDAPWEGSGPGFVHVGAGTGTEDPWIKYSANEPTGEWELRATAKNSRRQVIAYDYVGNHGTFAPWAILQRFVLRDGKTLLRETLVRRDQPSEFEYTGSTSFDLQAGDVYGFRIQGLTKDLAPRVEGALQLIVAPDTTAPTITPQLTGTAGEAGYYTSDVKVAWNVEDPETPDAPRTGCDETTVSADTDGQTLTCSATSPGGTTTKSVTVKRDATAPQLTVPETITKEVTGTERAAVAYAAVATDTLDPKPALACSPASGAVFPDGSTSVFCTATDAAGNETTKSFDVLVLRRADAPVTPPAPLAAPASVRQVNPVTITAPVQRKQINPVMSFRFTATNRVTRLQMLSVKNLPKGSTATIACTSKSCPRKLKGRTVGRRVKGTTLNISSLVRGPLKPGTVITVVVTSPNADPATKKLTVRKGKAPQVS
jgi:HYR domain